jgi:hypothetical protein
MNNPLASKIQIESQRHVANLAETMIKDHFRDSGKGTGILTVGNNRVVEKHASKSNIKHFTKEVFYDITIIITNNCSFIPDNYGKRYGCIRIRSEG